MKQERTKIIFHFVILLCLGTLGFSLVLHLSYTNYKKSVNQFVYNIVEQLKENYPDITEQEIISLLNQEKVASYDDTFLKYGITEEDAIIYSLEKQYQSGVILGVSFIILFWILFLVYFFCFFRRKEKKIQEITNYMKEINKRNYLLEIDNNSEGELSILRNEVYKVTVMLREESEQLKKEKILLKDSISDISHQLKTPLTSILILLDNILDNPDMEEATRKEFIKKVHYQVENINFLIVSMLKLSRIEADVVEFKKEKINVYSLFQEVIQNLEAFCELKQVHIRLTDFKELFYIGDYHWELEAMMNILKNAIEHSKEQSFIDVLVTENQLYTKIIIKDYGTGMNKKDLKNIFTRFYKGENSKKDSIGIGLNLAKNIIEKDNGFIKVNSIKDFGTTFEIKYLK